MGGSWEDHHAAQAYQQDRNQSDSQGPLKGAASSSRTGGYHDGPGPTHPELNSTAGQWNDLAFSILFLLTLVGVTVFGVYQSQQEIPLDSRDKFRIDKDQVWQYFIGPLCAIPFAIASSLINFWLMRSHASGYIYFNLIAFNVLLWCLAVFSFVVGAVLAGVLNVLMAIIHLWWVFAVKRRIAFTAAFFQMIMKALRKYPGVFVVTYLVLMVQIAVLIAFAYVGGRFLQVNNREGQDGRLAAGFIFLVFTLFWTFEVLQNIVHVTVSGTVGTWYFMGNDAPPNATTSALTRAVTKSFGSICFGSLLVAIVQTMRFIVQRLKDQARQDRNGAMLLFACCLDCMLSCLEWLVRYFNRYAFVQVALYGKSFIQAAKDTYAIMQERGIDMLINDEISGQVMFIAALVTGLAAGGIVGVTMAAMKGPWLAAGLISFVLVFLMMMVTFNVVSSAMAAVYVCYAEEPELLHRNHAELAPHFQFARQEAYERAHGDDDGYDGI